MSSPSEKRGKHIKALEKAEKLAKQAAQDKAELRRQRPAPAKSKNIPKKKTN